ncbi:unnamed protein product [Rhizophagus irregularis]|uniref:DNA-(apurinic or apyrimidinic site) endonuclease n=1 Tax=Rhizophagus irregularis TaxID=588596 RepID=A0A2N1P0F2_9GLOM|nr:DNase I-like protein [Rhizophagus irregularis]CAB4383533.1 unnamed protein product [Rhizophagus irregularis]CAB5389054.1 unnamed protein product [Rhizophagus irregularis]
MRIITWNVNGIRSITNYHPWSKHKDYKQVLDTLNADIICFQETKITLDKLDSSLAIVPGYDAYFSSSRGKGGYAGVVIYVKTSVIRPIAAEEGISGILNEVPANAKSKDVTTAGIGPSIISEFTTEELLEIDSEGRCVILDFGIFVLFNVYCVHESSQGRLPYKLRFYNILQRRAEALLDSGREVIIVGDLNVTHQVIDHCDPQKSIKEHGLKSFGDHPARKWLDSWISPNGPMIDLCRKFHPDEEGLFTCWNTLINARPINYGTRLDYILVSEGLTKWFKSCNVEQDIMGSDHCPVSCELFDEIYEGDNKLSLLKENTLMTLTPKLCAKNLVRFSGKQQTLKSFFIKQEIKEKEAQERKSVKTSNDNIVENIPETLTSNTIPTDSSIDISEGLKEQSEIKRKSGQASVIKVQKAKANSSKLIKEKSSKAQAKSKLSYPTNQVSLISLFKKASQDTPPEKKLEEVTKSIELKDSQGLQEKSTISENISDSSNSFEESLDDIINNVEDECIEVSSSNNKSDIQSQWNALFKPRPIPNCIGHGEPCKEYTVNKPGINQGRRFYLCSRPVGNSQESRCKFFEWTNGNKLKLSKSVKRYSDQKQDNGLNKKKRDF